MTETSKAIFQTQSFNNMHRDINEIVQGSWSPRELLMTSRLFLSAWSRAATATEIARTPLLCRHWWATKGDLGKLHHTLHDIYVLCNSGSETSLNTLKRLNYGPSFSQCLHLEMRDSGSSLYLRMAAARVSLRRQETSGMESW